MRENVSTRRVPSWGGHDVRPSATVVGNCNLGSLSTGSLIGHLRYDGLMYSQASVMPGNSGDSAAHVIVRGYFFYLSSHENWEREA